MKTILLLMLGLGMWMFMSGAPAGAAVTAHAEGQLVTLENECVTVQYDLATGKYRAASKQDAGARIDDATLKINAWASNEPGVKNEWSSAEVQDRLGQGRTLTVRSSGAARPTLVLTITLYEGKGFIALGGGIDKADGSDTRILENPSDVGGDGVCGAGRPGGLAHYERRSGGGAVRRDRSLRHGKSQQHSGYVQVGREAAFAGAGRVELP